MSRDKLIESKVEAYRQVIELKTAEELFGCDLQNMIDYEVSNLLSQYAFENDPAPEDVIGEERLQELIEDEINRRVAKYEEELREQPAEELLGEQHLQELADELLAKQAEQYEAELRAESPDDLLRSEMDHRLQKLESEYAAKLHTMTDDELCVTCDTLFEVTP